MNRAIADSPLSESSVACGRQRSRHSGLTLLELLITMVLAAIIAALAAPSFFSLIKNNQISSARTSLLAGIQLARAEALERKTPVTICASTHGGGCGGDWTDGWIVFTDIDSSGSIGTGDVLVEVHDGYGGTALGDDGTGGTITYLVTGMKNNAGAQNIGFCDEHGSANIQGKTISISATGSAGMSKAGAGC